MRCEHGFTRCGLCHDAAGNLWPQRLDIPVKCSGCAERDAEIERLLADVVRLQSAIRWALGYDEGTPDFSDDHGLGAFSWRKELMRRAALRGEGGE